MARGVRLCGVYLLALGCGPPRADSTRGERAEGASPGDMEAGARTDAAADALVATAPGGVEIWFTLAREATAADGTTCTDRTIEIRRDGERIPVPLLYTGTAPEIVNDSTMRARLSVDVRDNPESIFVQTAPGVYGLKGHAS